MGSTSGDGIRKLDTNYSEMSWRAFLWEMRDWIVKFELGMLVVVGMIAGVDFVITTMDPSAPSLGMMYAIPFMGQLMFLLKLTALKDDVLVEGGILPRMGGGA